METQNKFAVRRDPIELYFARKWHRDELKTETNPSIQNWTRLLRKNELQRGRNERKLELYTRKIVQNDFAIRRDPKALHSARIRRCYGLGWDTELSIQNWIRLLKRKELSRNKGKFELYRCKVEEATQRAFDTCFVNSMLTHFEPQLKEIYGDNVPRTKDNIPRIKEYCGGNSPSDAGPWIKMEDGRVIYLREGSG